MPFLSLPPAGLHLDGLYFTLTLSFMSRNLQFDSTDRTVNRELWAHIELIEPSFFRSMDR